MPNTNAYPVPGFDHPFARTNIQKIQQRAGLLRDLLPGIPSIAEICSGDRQAQYQLYRAELDILRFLGLDFSAEMVTLNRSRNIPCEYGSDSTTI